MHRTSVLPELSWSQFDCMQLMVSLPYSETFVENALTVTDCLTRAVNMDVVSIHKFGDINEIRPAVNRTNNTGSMQHWAMRNISSAIYYVPWILYLKTLTMKVCSCDNCDNAMMTEKARFGLDLSSWMGAVHIEDCDFPFRCLRFMKFKVVLM